MTNLYKPKLFCVMLVFVLGASRHKQKVPIAAALCANHMQLLRLIIECKNHSNALSIEERTQSKLMIKKEEIEKERERETKCFSDDKRASEKKLL